MSLLIVIITLLIFFGLCVISDQLKDIYNVLVEIARLLKGVTKMPDKLTDSEIIKALGICSKSTNGCSHNKYTCKDCYLNGQPMCSAVLIQDTIDLINRLQEKNLNLTSDLTSLQNDLTSLKAENEKLKKSNEMFADIGKLYSEIKAEAYKEFAEELKKKMVKHNFKYADTLFSANVATAPMVDNLLKELVGE